MNTFESATQEYLKQAKADETIRIHGRNEKIETYYNTWKGSPSWLKYQVHYPGGVTKTQEYLTMNLPRYFCRTWASNYANEDTKITLKDEKSNEHLKKILKKNKFFANFNNFVEMFMGLGIGATCVIPTSFLEDSDGNVSVDPKARTKIQLIGGRRVIPISVDDGEVRECAFVSYFTNGCKIIIHWLNDKGMYQISELRGKGEKGTYTFDYKNVRTLDTKSDIPLFQIWMPNVTNEDDDVDRSVGTSIFDRAFDTFRQCDLVYTAFFKEVKLGQKVKFVSSELQITDENGQKVETYDPNDESVIFVPSNTDALPSMNEFNGELRIQALVQCINFHMNSAGMLCGLGQSTFEFDGGGGRPIQTATGIIAKQNEMYKNIIKQENYATIALSKMVEAIVFVNNTFTNEEKMNYDENNVEIVFDDNILDDTQSKQERELKEVQSGAMSLAEYRSHWYDEDYDTALKFLQDNGMLINTYIVALQSGAMTPEQFVDLAYGPNCPYKAQLIAQLTQQPAEGYEDESEEDEEEENQDEVGE